jgi:hypothetical protein
VVSRQHAFLLDMLYWCTPNMEWYNDNDVWETEEDAPPPPPLPAAEAAAEAVEAEAAVEWAADATRPHGDPNKPMTEREEAMNEFLEKLFASDRLVRIGFMFGYVRRASIPTQPVMGCMPRESARQFWKPAAAVESALLSADLEPHSRRILLGT